MRFCPGLMVGGAYHEHTCALSRSLGYYLEPLAALAPFGKQALEIRLHGVTNDNRDISVRNMFQFEEGGVVL